MYAAAGDCLSLQSRLVLHNVHTFKSAALTAVHLQLTSLNSCKLAGLPQPFPHTNWCCDKMALLDGATLVQIPNVSMTACANHCCKLVLAYSLCCSVVWLPASRLACLPASLPCAPLNSIQPLMLPCWARHKPLLHPGPVVPAVLPAQALHAEFYNNNLRFFKP